MKHEIVALRFDLDAAARECQGKPTPDAIQILDVDLATLAEPDRGCLTRRLEQAKDNIFDVCKLQWDGTKEFRRPTRQEGLRDFYVVRFPVRVQALEPTLESLMEAVREDYRRFKVR